MCFRNSFNARKWFVNIILIINLIFLEYEKVYYENFDNYEEFGFLFYGDNLEYGILEALIKNLVKDVNKKKKIKNNNNLLIVEKIVKAITNTRRFN